MKLSVFIIAQNEVDRIARTLNSVKAIADEVIVIDSGSSDGTQALCESLGAKVLHNAWQGYGAQKRFGESQCANDWVLNLDADEVLTPALAAEIQATLQTPMKAGYIVQMQDTYPSEKGVAPFTYRKKFIRLYNKTKTQFSISPVHDTVEMAESEAGLLTNVCLHYSYRSLHHAIDKNNGYTSAQASDMLAKGKRVSLLRLLIEFPFSFVKIYFLRTHMLRGVEGFIYSVNYAYARFSRLAKLIEMHKCK